jgi:myo-inositol-1(or 4)-monophosphatase
MNTTSDYLKVCEEAARAGGAVLMDWIGRTEARNKGPRDLVTQADLASQEEVRRLVLGAFPDHCLLGEEDSPGETPTARAEFRWIVDPLDGTTNFVHSIPHFAVSLALEHRGRVLVGTIFNPIRQECFTAEAGRGAWLNGRPLRASKVAKLADALAVTGFPPNVQPDSPDLLLFNKVIFQCHSVHRTGCSSLNFAYLAAGWYDAFWSHSTKIWDVAAGVLLAREAGCTVTAPDGSPFVLDDASFLAAATGPLHAEVLRYV